MANSYNLARLKRHVPEWSEWRKDDPDYRSKLSTSPIRNTDSTRKIDFEALELLNADLQTANFQNNDLLTADLRTANLPNTNLLNAKLRDAKLRDVKVLYDTLMQSPLSKEYLDDKPRMPQNKFEYTGDVIRPLYWKREQEEAGRELAPDTLHNHQTIYTVTPIGDGLSLSSMFLHFPEGMAAENEPWLLDALATMGGTRILAPEVKSFEEMAEHLTPEGMDVETLTESLRKALTTNYAVIAVRNPLIDLGKELLEKAFPGGTIFTAMASADSVGTFFVYVGAATAGLVFIHLGKSIAAGNHTIIQALANRIAKRIDPPAEKPTKKPKKKN